MPNISFASDADRQLFARELETFVPGVIFDAHAHLWHVDHLPEDASAAFSQVDAAAVGVTTYRRWIADLLPGRRVEGGLFLPGAVGAKGNALAAQNAFLAAEVAAEPASTGAMLVSPGMDPDYVRRQVRRLGFRGLKPYHLQSLRSPTWDSQIPDYLPEWLAQLADEEHLFVTLHMVRSRAAADPSNQAWIRHYCERYPGMQLVLAHAARGFNPYHTVEGLQALRGLPNLWCDMSAVTEAGACEAILEILGYDRLLYGSDFPVSHLRGRCVAIGDGFVWLYDDTLDWAKVAHEPLRPVLVGLESLRVLKQAAWHCRLGDSQVEDLFRNNARRLLGLA